MYRGPTMNAGISAINAYGLYDSEMSIIVIFVLARLQGIPMEAILKRVENIESRGSIRSEIIPSSLTDARTRTPSGLYTREWYTERTEGRHSPSGVGEPLG